MIFVDPDTGLMITCEPWEYAEMAKARGWYKTKWES